MIEFDGNIYDDRWLATIKYQENRSGLEVLTDMFKQRKVKKRSSGFVKENLMFYKIFEKLWFMNIGEVLKEFFYTFYDRSKYYENCRIYG